MILRDVGAASASVASSAKEDSVSALSSIAVSVSDDSVSDDSVSGSIFIVSGPLESEAAVSASFGGWLGASVLCASSVFSLASLGSKR